MCACQCMRAHSCVTCLHRAPSLQVFKQRMAQAVLGEDAAAGDDGAGLLSLFSAPPPAARASSPAARAALLLTGWADGAADAGDDADTALPVPAWPDDALDWLQEGQAEGEAEPGGWAEVEAALERSVGGRPGQ